MTWVREVPGSIELKITGGLITHYRDRGNVRVDLWKVHTQADGTQEEVKVSHAESAPDGVERLVRLKPKQTGLHKIPVPKGADAAIWRFRNSTGTKRLMTVPPCLAPSPQQLLLPPETVNTDSAQSPSASLEMTIVGPSGLRSK